MYEASKCSPQESLRNLDQTFANFFAKRALYPTRKKRSKGVGGFRLTGVIRVTLKHIQLPVLGRIRIKPGDHGYLPLGKCSQASVTEKAWRRWQYELAKERVRRHEWLWMDGLGEQHPSQPRHRSTRRLHPRFPRTNTQTLLTPLVLWERAVLQRQGETVHPTEDGRG